MPAMFANGYAPLPLFSKEPLIKGWTEIFCEQQLSEDDVHFWGIGYRGVVLDGVGVACRSGFTVIDIDLNEQSSLERLRHIIPWVDIAPACKGQRGPKLFCRSVDGLSRKDWAISPQSTG